MRTAMCIKSNRLIFTYSSVTEYVRINHVDTTT